MTRVGPVSEKVCQIEANQVILCGKMPKVLFYDSENKKLISSSINGVELLDILKVNDKIIAIT